MPRHIHLHSHLAHRGARPTLPGGEGGPQAQVVADPVATRPGRTATEVSAAADDRA